MEEKKISIDGLQELDRVARQVLEYLQDQKVVAFYGKMGAGKTTLIKAMCKALGVEDNVSSPTFSLVNEYIDNQGNIIYHFDFYRLKSQEEAFDLGYEDYLYSNGLCLIEWPEKIADLIPDDCAKITIEIEQNERRIVSLG